MDLSGLFMLSIVIPLYNEASLIDELVARVVSLSKQIDCEIEIIFVDDGSTDDTLEKLLKHRSAHASIKVLELSRNFGHQAAYTAGLQQVNGQYVAILDGDLQDPPELIANMYDKLIAEELDVVYGKRLNSSIKHRRPLLSILFHKLSKRLSGFQDIDNVGNFSLMNAKALQALLEFRETNRYLPGLRAFIGFKQGFVEYQRSDRFAGSSKMTFSQLISLSSDAIFSFSKLPIRICLYLGITGIVVFFLAGLYTLIAKIAGFALFGWSSTVLSIYFLGSIQLTFLGILGEYIFRIHTESQKRPLFFIKEYHN